MAEYREYLRSKINLPPSKGVYERDSDTLFLFDGIHTGQARHDLGDATIPVLLRSGSRTEAEIEAGRANAAHGAKRSNADKHHAVKLLLHNPDLCVRSNNWLANTAMVSPQLVAEARIELEKDSINPIFRPKKRRVLRNGTVYEVLASSTSTPPSAGTRRGGSCSGAADRTPLRQSR